MLILKAMVTGMLVSLPVGPVGIYCMEKIIVEGRRAGTSSILGMLIVDVFYGVLAFKSLKYMSSFIESYTFILKFVLGLLLIFIGYRKYRAEVVIKEIENTDETAIKNVVAASAITILNPSTILLFIVMFAGLRIFNTPNLITFGNIGIGIFLGGLSLWCIIIEALLKWRKKITDHTVERISKSSGLLLLVFGIGILISSLI